jgi:hypothetical protein
MVGLDELGPEIGLAFEVMIKTALGHFGATQDLVDPDRRIALLGQMLEPRPDQRLAGAGILGFRLGPTTAFGWGIAHGNLIDRFVQ